MDQYLPNKFLFLGSYEKVLEMSQRMKDKVQKFLQDNVSAFLLDPSQTPNEIAEIRLKFSNVDKTENQASLRLAPKQANAIETYEGFNKQPTTKDINLQLTKLLRELKIVGASAHSIRHSATTELAKLEV
ncbi:MAG: hypothetical protein EZS28_037457 [Streblomastix strix]|uniref:Uncharacterized protein n=1 Tax=Streblomastix strix TaxID=222440 RepID=A0A5J4U815_9EUKA|nr:MAG: hypothetical protein EZS28_037457 [Streblomastix strix]